VVLVAVLAFEVPKVLHSGTKTSATPPPATTDATAAPTATPTATPAVTPAGTAAAAVTPTAASSKLSNSDLPPRAGKAQLYAFGHFAGKDPFVQQVSADALTGAANSSTSAASSNQATASQTAKVKINHPTRTLAATGTARISVNGRVQLVRVGKSFPSANPLFKLVSVSGGVAKIGISSGSYSSGAQTVSLVAGRTLTLVDTADGIRYQLRLLS
jgi:hypothetical protein